MTASAPPEPGALIADRYRLLDELGRGGMGVVWRAEHVALGKQVAVKLVTSQGGDFLERFKREARLLARVDHPGVCGVTDFGVTADGAFFLVMELLDGQTLDRVLVRDGRVPMRVALGVFRQVADALAACHAAGIVHRDLKPENIMLLRGPGPAPDVPTVKVLDFGIAVSTLPDDGAPRVTRAGIVLGTPAFMSPEQATGGDVDARSDIYALGLMLVEAIAGYNPFEKGNALKTMAAHSHEEAPALSALVPELDVPPDLDVLVARMLVKEPAGRVQSAREVSAALSALASGAPTHLTRPEPAFNADLGARPTREEGKGGGGTPWLLWLLVLVLVGGVVAFIATLEPDVRPATDLDAIGDARRGRDAGGVSVGTIEGLTVTAHSIATGVEGRQPTGVGTAFSADVGKVYCHIRVKNEGAHRRVVLVWYRNDEERFRVNLKVGESPAWHTWGEARLSDKLTGAWRCDIQTPDGALLSSASFEVTPGASPAP